MAGGGPQAPAPASYRRSRRVFLRGLGLVYAVAFGSLWVQVHGLVGDGGIAPVEPRLAAWADAAGRAGLSPAERWARWPTLLWLHAGDAALHGLCAVGVAASILLVGGRLQAVAAAVAWVAYLSLTVAGEPFLAFQWDVLLLETGLLAVVCAPWHRRTAPEVDREPPAVARWLVWLLLFRLMFLSGAVKLASGDPAWSDGTALAYHFETQPLPTPLAWHAHHLPGGALRWGCFGMFAVELAVPFLVFAPRRLRRWAVPPLVLLQVAIALTGNYGFFNALTVVLCLALLDDGALGGSGRRAETPARRSGPAQRLAAWALAAAVGPLGALHVVRVVGDWTGQAELASLGTPVLRAAGPLRSVNSYGLFRVMTTERAEIVVEGSADGDTWLPYVFRHKPQDEASASGWVQPHMPRLDWQMWFLPFPWFAGHSWERHGAWFRGLLRALLEGSPRVRALFADDPFPEVPPRFVRARVSRFSFASPEARAATGRTWVRTPYPDPEFVPPISLNRGSDRPSPGLRRR